MLQSFLQHANWLSILVAALAFFALGSLWFSLLFGKIWQKEVERQGIKRMDPKGGEIAMKMIQTFVCNAAAAIAIALLMYVSGLSGTVNGAKLGLLCGVGFAAAAVVISGVWESRSIRLMAIDLGYPLVGIIVCGIILGAWR